VLKRREIATFWRWSRAHGMGTVGALEVARIEFNQRVLDRIGLGPAVVVPSARRRVEFRCRVLSGWGQNVGALRQSCGNCERKWLKGPQNFRDL